MTPAELGAAVRSVVAAAVQAGELDVEVPAEVPVERPRVKEHGDYATSVALQLAKASGKKPRDVAELLAARLREVATHDPQQRPVLLRTEMSAGHGGRSGRYAAWEQIAWEWAFVLDQLGATQPLTD